MTRSDLIVIGSGIVGMAHAAIAALTGRRVVLIERSTRPVGASIRNFGMVWPVGQTEGRGLDRALRSRARWLDFSERAGFWARACGSLHIAREEDEAAVLREFVAAAPASRGVVVLPPDEAIERCPPLRRDGLLAAMWSPTEVAVDAREAVQSIHDWLVVHERVEVVPRTHAVAVDAGVVRTADGRVFEAGAIVCCPGDDTRSLFPELFASVPTRRCKLQMMRTGPQPADWDLGVHLAGGLTLRHYASFEACPSLAAVRERVARETPEFDRHGIHVMASQNGLGEIVIGDSHEYADDFGPGLDAEIDRLILEYLHGMIEIAAPTITERWYGTYLKATNAEALLVEAPMEGVRVVTGVGGAGMTLSFGIAEEVLTDLGLGEGWSASVEATPAGAPTTT